MRIIHLASGDLWAGAEVQLFHLAFNLNEHEDVYLLVVLLNDGQLAKALRERNIDVVILDESKYSFLKIMVKFYKLCRQFNPDLVHTHRTKENIIGGTLSWLTRSKGIRTVHGASEFTFNIKSKIINLIDNFVACAFQNKVISVSHELKQKLEEYCFRKKIEVIENCVDVEYISNMASKHNNYIINNDYFNIAFVGRFVEVKRTDLFVGIAADLKKRYPEQKIKFHMFGDGPLWEETNRYVNEQGLDSTVSLAGFVDNSAPYIKKMDLLLITSDHEGLPMTLLESMVMKVPVMSRNLRTIKHVLCQGECGYILEESDIRVFSNSIIKLLNEKNKYNEIKNRAYEIVENKYSIKVLIERYIQLYKSLLAP